MNKNTDYNIKRITSYKEKGFELDPFNRIEKAKYEVTCNACGRKWRYQRMCGTVKACANNNAVCPCGEKNNFTVINL